MELTALNGLKKWYLWYKKPKKSKEVKQKEIENNLLIEIAAIKRETTMFLFSSHY